MDLFEMRQIGKTDMRASALALGGGWLAPPDQDDSVGINLVRRALEMGINYIDTSPSYWESERLIGEALVGVSRESYYLSTKVGTHPDRPKDYSPASLRWSAQQSLKQLNVDYFDILLIHDPTEEDVEAILAPGGGLDEMVQMRDEGLTRYIGIGVRSHEWHKRAIETGKTDVMLTYMDYTLVNQSAAQDILPLAAQRGVGVILGSPLAGGLLGGREPDDAKLPRDWRDQFEAAHAMWQWCKDRGRCVRDFAIQFCLALPMQGVVLSGPRNVRELQEVVDSATKPIPQELWDEFQREFGIVPAR